MKRFLEMIEHVKSAGEIMYLDDGPGRTKEMPVALFFKYAEAAEILVFHPKHKEPLDLQEKYGEDIYINYSSPFSVFAFEVFGGNITEPSGHREKMAAIKDLLTTDPAELLGRDIKGEVDIFGDGVDAWIHCILAWEAAPDRFGYYVYCTANGRKLVFLTNTLDRLTKEFIDRVNSNREAVGAEPVRQRVKIGSGQDKRMHTIRRVVHIRSKKVGYDLAPETRNVDWTHRFIRRGAWRRKGMEGKLGKDRAGNYCVQDATWVVETVVGPKDKPLIHKTRVVD